MNFNEAIQMLGNKLQEKYGYLGFKYKNLTKHLQGTVKISHI